MSKPDVKNFFYSTDDDPDSIFFPRPDGSTLQRTFPHINKGNFPGSVNDLNIQLQRYIANPGDQLAVSQINLDLGTLSRITGLGVNEIVRYLEIPKELCAPFIKSLTG